MKCREMNPGKRDTLPGEWTERVPSMKCREMNPGKRAGQPRTSPRMRTLNEVPGNESRQTPRPNHRAPQAGHPSMKCREMNPGKRGGPARRGGRRPPSMKCREMNPGKRGDGRRCRGAGKPSMKCREMNPGKRPHSNTHYQQGSYRKVREVQYISSVFANNTGHERRKGHRKWSARTKKPHCERSSRKYQAIQLSLEINCHHSSFFKQREHPAQSQNEL